MKNPQDQFADWMDRWEKAQQDGTFADAPKPAAPQTQHSPDFFGQYPSPKPGKDIDAEYWRQVYQRSSGAGDAPDVADNYAFADGGDHHLQDQKKAPKGKKLREGKDDYGPGFDPVETSEKVNLPKKEDKEELGKQAAAMARSPNPVYHHSLGKDQGPRVTPNWAGGPKIERVVELKRELYELESKINALEGFGKPDRSLANKVKQLRDRLDDISDELTPGRLEEPLS